MGDPFRSLRSAVRSCFLKENNSSPEPIENTSDLDITENGPIGALTKGTPDMMEGMMSAMDHIIEIQSNPGRRENAQLCKEFIREHGWATGDYCIWALKGVVLVLTEEQVLALPQSNPAMRDVFTLVSRHKPVLFFCVLSSRPCLMVTTGRAPENASV